MTRALPIAILLAGCTFDAGTGFATVESAILTAVLEPGEARDTGDGFLTDQAYEVRVDRATLEVDRMELQALSGGGGGGTFDPASPPPGYTLCHGGHCHADDGRLVPYAEVEAELAGGAASFVPVVTLPVEGTFDIAAGESRTLETFDPSAELPETRLRRLVVSLARMTIEGAVSGAGLGDTEVPLSIDIAPPGNVSAGLDRPVDRDHPATIRLAVAVVFDGTILDEVDLAALVVDGAIAIDSPDAPGAEALLAAVAASEPAVDM